MSARCWLLAATVLAAQAYAGPLQADCPAQCPECPEELDCRLTVMDQCNCCPVCVRDVGESCGPSEGVCASHLSCEQSEDSDESGICTDTLPERCLKANCSVVFHPSCPSDSRLVIQLPPHGECCGRPGTCHCDQQKCASMVPTCDSGKERVLIKEGKTEPGKCCDVFECRTKETQCETIHCPPLLDEDLGSECPADSVKPPPHIPIGGCCQIQPGCRCRASECRPAVCPEGKKLKIIKKGNGNPGRCCDEWECEDDSKPIGKSCERDGKVYSDGQEWLASVCDTCKCKKGVAVCRKMTCPKTATDCTWVMIPEDECCPVCVGCQTDKMEKKKKHETWQKDDCTTCTCSEEGTAVCEKYMCSVSCENPRKVEGQCCPVCDEPTVLTLPASCPSLEHCPLRCENGLQRDDRGCFECKCLPVDHPHSVDCPQLSKDNCDKQCAHGYLKDENACVVCRCAKCPPLHQCFKHCLYGFETNSVGCPVCKCRAISRIDAKLTTITDKLGKLAGWDRCVSMTSDGKVVERDGGEWWNDGCRHCFCEQKQEFCSLISCPPRPETCAEKDWQQKEGACCPTCMTSVSTTATSKHEHTVCQSPGTGRLFTDGETWQLAPCISCTCRVGHVLCRTVDCPPIACKEPLLHPNDQCCPRCPEDSSNATSKETNIFCTDEHESVHKYGSAWRTDDCTSCTCSDDASVTCFKESCDEVTSCNGSPLVIKGKCCPVCSDALSSTDMCTYKSAIYAVGEEWKEGDCTKCSCIAGGQTICKETVCPPCVDAVPIDGQCCPLCKDSGLLSLSEGIGGSILVPSTSISSNLPLMGLSLMTLVILGLLVLLLILYKRSRCSNKCQPLIVNDNVRLAASKQLGSSTKLTDEWMNRRDSQSDGQSESLLSTASDTLTATSSASSGTGPHPDTRPLTSSVPKFNV